MNENDQIVYQQTALEMLRRYRMDLRPMPVNMAVLARNMGIVVLNSPLKTGDVEFMDFQYAADQMPANMRKIAGGGCNKVIRVRNDCTENEKTVLIASMLVFVHISLSRDDKEEEHREKKLTACSRFSLSDLDGQLASFRLTGLCLLMSPLSLAFYFKNRTKSTPEKIIHSIRELDRFCLYFRVAQREAVDRLALLERPEEE